MPSHTITPTVPDHLAVENGDKVYEEESALSATGRRVAHKAQNMPWQAPDASSAPALRLERRMWARSGRKRLSKVSGGGKHGWLQNYWR